MPAHSSLPLTSENLLFNVVSTLSKEVHQLSLKEGAEQVELSFLSFSTKFATLTYSSHLPSLLSLSLTHPISPRSSYLPSLLLHSLLPSPSLISFPLPHPISPHSSHASSLISSPLTPPISSHSHLHSLILSPLTPPISTHSSYLPSLLPSPLTRPISLHSSHDPSSVQMQETPLERHYHEDIIDRRADELQRHMEALEVCSRYVGVRWLNFFGCLCYPV